MPRRPRRDTPDSWHHVVNRAIARRTLFERREDFRYFMAQLARAVRRGELEVHAFCLMGTHYHLLARSPRGELWRGMQRVQLAYSRWFNRSRRRDGTLVRGRYFSKRVDSLVYRRALVRYIDSNPVAAGIVGRAADYPYGSAAHYASCVGPPWLERSWVEGAVSSEACAGDYEPSDYARAFGTMPDGLAEVMEARLAHASQRDPLDNLVSASSAHVRSWMVRKARLADGTTPNLPILALGWLESVLRAEQHEPWRIRQGQLDRDAWPVVLAGLGRSLAGASLTLLAGRLGVSPSTASKLSRMHEQWMQESEEYTSRAAQIAHRALRGWGGCVEVNLVPYHASSNCSSSVEPAMAVVEALPPETVWVTLSK